MESNASPHVLLVLMVKNEAKLLPRCLQAAAPFVDASFVFDTGSSDNTVALAQAAGCGTAQEPWLDFGRSRTASLKAARAHVVRTLGWRLTDCYALVLDADMVLRGDPVAFSQYISQAFRAGASGIEVTQHLGPLVYQNTRLMRLVDAWWCNGATHEFWTGGRADRVARLDARLLWIQDLGDGGCKQDKFERDERLLSAALQDDPSDVRSLFYLAQTCKDAGKHEEAIRLYRQRIDAGGWLEEVWYSHYMITQSLLQLRDFRGAAREVKTAASVCKDRVEPAMCLAAALRAEGSRIWAAQRAAVQAEGAPDDAPRLAAPDESVALFKKAWRYLELCAGLPLPASDRLFVEPEAYGARQHLERSHLAYFCAQHDPAQGLVAALSCTGAGEYEAMLNAICYAQPLLGARWKRLHFPVPAGFNSSSTAISGDLLCVRCVNYTILPDGGYIMPGGRVATRNFLATWKGFEEVEYLASDMTELVPAPSHARRPDETILGLEDVRLFGAAHFTATTREFSYGPFNRIAWGTFCLSSAGAIADFKILRPPQETSCEKNWTPLDANNFIYRWSPLEIYRVVGAEVELVSTQATPAWFRHVRGSTPLVEVADGRLLGLVHVVSPHSPRVYLHCFVWFSQDWKLLSYTLPFVLRLRGIEYTVGLTLREDQAIIFASCLDQETWMGAVDLSACSALALAV